METDVLGKKKLPLFLNGKLTVCADGQFTERLINICMHRGLVIRNVQKCGNNRVIFTTDVDSFKKIRTPVKRTKSKVKIIKKSGLPFILNRFKHRKAAVVGTALICVLLIYCSTHIMGITVFGNSRIEKKRITDELSSAGLTIGARTSDIDPDTIRNTLMNRIDELAWLGVNANGSHVYIEVVERIEKEQGLDKNDLPCNLVASRDGIIELAEVREGQTVVQKGSGVAQGDVLVSGIVNNSKNGFTFVHSRGEIIAETEYKKTRSYALEYSEDVPTGKTKKRYSMSVLNYTLPLYIGKTAPYEQFTHNQNESEYRIPLDILPSLFIKCDEYSETQTIHKKRTSQEAAAFGKEELTSELKSEAETNENIKEIKSITSEQSLNEHGEIEITVTLKCSENIAVSSVIEEPLLEKSDSTDK